MLIALALSDGGDLVVLWSVMKLLAMHKAGCSVDSNVQPDCSAATRCHSVLTCCIPPRRRCGYGTMRSQTPCWQRSGWRRAR